MIERANVTNGPGMIEQHDDPEFFVNTARCIEFEGRHYCPAEQLSFGTRSAESGKSLALMLGNGRFGLHWQLTVHGARQLAEMLLNSAAIVDAEQADEAQAMLAATLDKGKPDGI